MKARSSSYWLEYLDSTGQNRGYHRSSEKVEEIDESLEKNKKEERNKMYYPLATLNKEKQFVVVDKEGSGDLSFHESVEDAQKYATRKLREGKEFIILKLVCSVRPKPLDAEIDTYE